ncbi:MAG: AMP-binding protein, partial [Anaerolineae bacterium]|nr:AMP-binding protein [Anaerolineae bacterium]
FRGEGVIDNFWKIADYYDCTLLAAVPTLFKALLNVPIGDSDISKLKIASSGAAPLPLELARQFTEYSGVKILEGYGLTEGTSVSATNPTYGESRAGSVGFRYPYQEIRPAIAYGSDFERFCEPDEVGVLLIRGPNVFPGYREAFHNKGAFVDTGDGKGPWFNTGDMGRLDADNYLWLTGRTKELIIRGGHNIDPKLIEDPMHLHPAVALAAAVGRPDAKAGELPVVYVELKPGMTATEAELLEFARENIGERAAIPKQIHIVEDIPLTAVGKVHKPTLSHQEVADVFSQELKALDGISDFTVKVEPDKRLGKIAHISVTAGNGADKAALEQKVREVLGFYTVPFELNIE